MGGPRDRRGASRPGIGRLPDRDHGQGDPGAVHRPLRSRFRLRRGAHHHRLHPPSAPEGFGGPPSAPRPARPSGPVDARLRTRIHRADFRGGPLLRSRLSDSDRTFHGLPQPGPGRGRGAFRPAWSSIPRRPGPGGGGGRGEPAGGLDSLRPRACRGLPAPGPTRSWAEASGGPAPAPAADTRGIALPGSPSEPHLAGPATSRKPLI